MGGADKNDKKNAMLAYAATHRLIGPGENDCIAAVLGCAATHRLIETDQRVVVGAIASRPPRSHTLDQYWTVLR
eukprot:3107174-Rhodomonas_salina.2